MRIFRATGCVLVFFCTLSEANAIDVKVVNNIYVNEVYRFSIPLTKVFRACYAPPVGSEHDVLLLQKEEKCSFGQHSVSISVSAYYRMPSDRTTDDIAKVICDSGSAVKSDLNFGAESLYLCGGDEENQQKYFAVHDFNFSRGSESVKYFVTVNNSSRKNADDHSVRQVLSGVKFN